MARMGQIGKKAQHFGSTYQKRHRIQYQDASSQPLVHADPPSSSTVARSMEPSQDGAIVARQSDEQALPDDVIERVVELPPVRVQRAQASDPDDGGQKDDNASAEKVAELVYKKLLQDTRQDSLRRNGQRR